MWYVKGWDIDGTHYDGDRSGAYGNFAGCAPRTAKHHELGLMAAYKVQNGPIKDSTFKAHHMMHKASQNQVDGSDQRTAPGQRLPPSTCTTKPATTGGPGGRAGRTPCSITLLRHLPLALALCAREERHENGKEAR